MICLANRSGTQMLSTVFVSKTGHVAVVDGGYYKDGDFLFSKLMELGGRVDHWFITHAHFSPSAKSVKRVCHEVHEHTHSRNVLLSVDVVVERVRWILLGRLSVEGVPKGEPLCAEAHGAFSQQKEPAVLSAEIRRHLLRRNGALRPLPPHVGGHEENSDLTGKIV